MSNLSLFKAAGLADVKSMASSLTALKRDAHTAPSLGGAALLKLDKGLGEWVYGVDSEEVGTQRVAINPASFTFLESKCTSLMVTPVSPVTAFIFTL